MTDAIPVNRGAWRDLDGRMWSDELWPRAFWFDAFLSHRRFDWSGELAAQLAARGLRVYHDGDVAVHDARVRTELDLALRHSRFIIACATPSLADSIYVRLECLPALKHSESTGIPRVVVARRSAGLAVPAEFGSLLSFDAGDDRGVDALAAFLTAQNRVSFPKVLPATMPFAGVFPADGKARLEQLDRTAGGSTDEMLTRSALRALGCMAQDVIDAATQSLLDRQQWQVLIYKRILESNTVPDGWHDYIWRCAFVLMHAPETADVGTKVFLWAARRGGVPGESRFLTERIWAETTARGQAYLCALLLDRLVEISGATMELIERAVVTFPGMFLESRSGLTASVPAAARVKLGVPGLHDKDLPPSERLHLIQQRLSHLQQRSTAEQSALPRLALEDELRDLRLTMRDPSLPVDGLIELFERALNPGDDQPSLLLQLEPPELLWVVYSPLGTLHDEDPERVRPLMHSVRRAFETRGYRRTAQVIDQQIAEAGPFETVALELAFVDDYVSLNS